MIISVYSLLIVMRMGRLKLMDVRAMRAASSMCFSLARCVTLAPKNVRVRLEGYRHVSGTLELKVSHKINETLWYPIEMVKF